MFGRSHHGAASRPFRIEALIFGLSPAAMAAFLLAFGCSSDSTPPPPPPDCSSVADTSMPATVSYSNDIVHLYTTDKYSCLDIACHGGGLISSDYSLNSYQEAMLQGEQARQLNMCMIKPGDPDHSYFVWKLEGRPGIMMGPMPDGCEIGTNECATEEDIQLVRTWIAEGARNN